MPKLLHEIKTDVRFARSHTLQPGWYKVLKVFLLFGFLIGYWALFGLARTVIFLLVFLLLSLAVHIIYRTMTKTWTQNWLDFTAAGPDGTAPRRIGPYYYLAVAFNACIAIAISQLYR